MNRDGIPDVLQQPQISYAAPVQQAAPAVTYSTHSEHAAPAPVVDNVSHLEQCERVGSRPHLNRSFTATTLLRSVRKLLWRSGERPLMSQFVASSVGLLVGLGRYLCAGTAHSGPGTAEVVATSDTRVPVSQDWRRSRLS